MATSIDQRVVEMRFDNKQFEENVKTTMSTLEKFKQSLKFDKASEGLDKIKSATKNFNMSSMESSIDAVNVKFSAMQVIGTTALANLTNTAVNAGKRIFSAMTNSIVQGGIRRAMNIEQAKFQLEGLGVAWKDVEEDIDYAVSGTAYGMDVAAKAAAQFTASGIQAGDSMKTALRSISGVAAMTNSSYEEISRIFTSIAGQNRVMGNDLLQLSGRGINAAATLGKYLGKTEGEVRQMVSKGQIDFATFAIAMDDAFGEHAKDANKTFTGALSNMKAALARIGAEVATPALANLRDIFNALRVTINNTKKALMPFIDAINRVQTAAAKSFVEFANLGGVDTLIKSIGNVFVGLWSVLKPVKDAFREIFPAPTMRALIDFTIQLRNFTSRLKLSAETSENLKNTFKGLFTILQSVLSVLFKIVSVVGKVLFTVASSVFKTLGGIILTVTGNIGKGIVALRAWVDSILELESVQFIFAVISTVINNLLSAFKVLTSKVRELSQAFINGAFSAVGTIFSSIGKVLLSVIGIVDRLIQKVRRFAEQVWLDPKVQEQVENLKNSFDNLLGILTNVYSFIKGKLISGFNTAKNAIKSFVSRVRELLGVYVKIPSAQEALNSVFTFFTDLVKNAGELLNSAKEGISAFIDKVVEINQVSFGKAINNFKQLKQNVSNSLDLGGKVDGAKNLLTSFADGTVNAFHFLGTATTNVQTRITDLVKFVNEKLSGVSMGDVMAAGVGSSIMVFLFSLAQAARDLSKGITSVLKVAGKFGKVLDSLVGAVDSINGYFQAQTTKLRVSMITDIIKSVAILAAAIAVLAMMDADRVRDSAVVVGVLAAVLIALSTAASYLAKTVKADEVAKSGVSVISLAAAIGILALSLKLLSSIDAESMKTGIIGLTAIMIEMMALMIIVDKFTKAEGKVSLSFLGAAASILILSMAMAKLGSMDKSSIESALGVITLLMGLLAFVAIASKNVRIGAAFTLIAAAAAVKLLVEGLKGIAEMDPGQLSSGIQSLIKIIGILALLMIAVSKAGAHATKAGVAIVLISAAMLILIEAIKKFADIDDGLITRATSSMMKVMFLFSVLIMATKFAGEHAARAGAAILMMSAAMILLSGAMVVMSRIEPDKLENATNAIIKIEVMFALIIAATSKAKQAEKVIIAIGVVLAALAAILLIASLIEPENLLAASVAITLMGGMLAGLIASTKHAKRAYPLLIFMGLIMAELAVILRKLSELPIQSVLGSAVGLSVLLLAISKAMVVLTKLPPDLWAMSKNLLGVLAIIAVIAAVIAAVAGLNKLIPSLADFINSGAPLLEAFGKSIGIVFGSIIAGAVEVISGTIPLIGTRLSEFATNVSGFMDWARSVDQSALDGIIKFTEIMALMTASDFLNLLMSPFDDKQTESMQKFFEKLPGFATSMKSFAEELNGVDLTTLSVAAEAAKDLASIYQFLPNITYDDGSVDLSSAIFGNKIGLDKFAEQIKALVSTIVEVNNTIAGENGVKSIDPANFEIVKQAAQHMVDLQNSLEAKGGIAQGFTGWRDIGQLGVDIKQLVENLQTANDAVNEFGGEIDKDKWNNVKAIGENLYELEKSMDVNVYGIGAIFTGYKDISVLGSDIKKYVEQISKANDAVEDMSDVDRAKWGELIAVSQGLVNLSNTLGDNEAGFGDLFGDGWSSLATLGGQVSVLVEQLSKANDSVNDMADIDTDKWNQVISVSQGLVDLHNVLSPNSGSVIKWWAGASDLGVFGDQIKKFGDGISGFAGSVQEVSFDGVPAAMEAANLLCDLSNKIQESGGTEGGFISWFAGQESNLGTFGDNLTNFGKGLYNFSDSVKDIQPGNMNAAINITIGFIEMANRLNEGETTLYDKMASLGAGLTEFGGNISDFNTSISAVDPGKIRTTMDMVQSVIDFGNTVTSSINTEILSQYGEALKNMAVTGVDAFVTGMTSDDAKGKARDSISNFVEGVTTSIENSVRSVKVRFKDAGKTLVLEFCKGIDNNTYLVGTSVTKLVTACVNGLNSQTNIDKYENSGMYAVKGYARGLSDNRRIAADAAREVAASASSALANYNEEGSPSKLYERHAMFNVLGYARGYLKYSHVAESASLEMATKTANALQTSISRAAELAQEDLNFYPTITPVIDLTDAEIQAKRLNSLIGNNYIMPVEKIMVKAQRAIPNQNGTEVTTLQPDPNQVPTQMNFVQNNYSPKPLSRVDIYRQTRNQFAMARGALSKR